MSNITPKIVEANIQAGNLSEASTQVVEVLKDHPESARAHLLKAYILEKQGNKAESQKEYSQVISLDKTGDTINSPMYKALTQEYVVINSVQPQHEESHVMAYFGVTAVLAIIVVLLYKHFTKEPPKRKPVRNFEPQRKADVQKPAAPVVKPVAPAISNFVSPLAQVTPVQQVYPAQQSSSGPGILDIAAGVAIGEVVGNALSHNDRVRTYDYSRPDNDFDQQEWRRSQERRREEERRRNRQDDYVSSVDIPVIDSDPTPTRSSSLSSSSSRSNSWDDDSSSKSSSSSNSSSWGSDSGSSWGSDSGSSWSSSSSDSSSYDSSSSGSSDW